MHPELRRARSLYHAWRLLPDTDRRGSEDAAFQVRELALDLRGHADAREAERELARANAVLAAALADATMRRAA